MFQTCETCWLTTLKNERRCCKLKNVLNTPCEHRVGKLRSNVQPDDNNMFMCDNCYENYETYLYVRKKAHKTLELNFKLIKMCYVAIAEQEDGEINLEFASALETECQEIVRVLNSNTSLKMKFDNLKEFYRRGEDSQNSTN